MLREDAEVLISRAVKVFGPVARKIGEEVLSETKDVKEFEIKFVDRLGKITGNRTLVRNIIHGV
ncbi:MAG: hypothetical protein ACP5H8_00390 [Candidatus Micrarchaeia archaeon]